MLSGNREAVQAQCALGKGSGQLPAWTAGTHQPNMLDWKHGLIPEC